MTGIGASKGDAMGNRWQHAARVRKNEFQVRATLQRVRKNEIDDRAGRVTRKFEQRRRTSQSNCLEASRRGRVQKDCRVTRIERIEDRRKRGIPKIFAVSVRLDDDAIQLQFVERMFDRAKRSFDMWQREGREAPEAARMRLDRLRDVFVDPVRQLHADRLIGQKSDARRRY
jgi:hypothetical protein